MKALSRLVIGLVIALSCGGALAQFGLTQSPTVRPPVPAASAPRHETFGPAPPPSPSTYVSPDSPANSQAPSSSGGSQSNCCMGGSGTGGGGSSAAGSSWMGATPPAPEAASPNNDEPHQSMGSAPQPQEATESATPRKDAGVVYPLWYGTNRAQISSGPTKVSYTDKYAADMSYGKVLVDIPEDFLKAPSWLDLFRSAERRIRVRTPVPMDKDSFFAGMRAQLQGQDEHDALIYIHGFHTTFVEAAQRAAAIGYQLKMPLTLFYSWPSQGRAADYLTDLTLVERSQDSIAQFLIDAVKRSGATRVHVIAHSMGNEGMLRAMLSPLMQQAIQNHIHFGQIILAAPDVDKEEFNEKAKVYTAVADRVTLYASSNDVALNLSKKLRPTLDRAGLVPPPVQAPGVDVVDVGNVNLTLLGHKYVAEEIHVLQDMFTLVRDNRPPIDRFGITPFTRSDLKHTYWVMNYR
jgi:esterase/lipase superfamily enzyme